MRLYLAIITLIYDGGKCTHSEVKQAAERMILCRRAHKKQSNPSQMRFFWVKDAIRVHNLSSF